MIRCHVEEAILPRDNQKSTIDRSSAEPEHCRRDVLYAGAVFYVRVSARRES